MRILFSVILLVLFTSGCAELIEMQKKQRVQNAAEQNGSSEEGTSASTTNESDNPYDQFNKSSRNASNDLKSRQQNMVHILRKANGTTIEFWIDLYNDDVKIDYEFDNSTTLEEQVELMPTKYKEISGSNNSENKSNTAESSNQLQLYLASYEKAQQLSYEQKYTEALENINKALNMSPNVVQGWKLKGSILYKLNDKVGARKAWAQALALDPYAKDVEKSLAELDRK